MDPMEVGVAVDLILRVAFLLVGRVAVVEVVALLVVLEGGLYLGPPIESSPFRGELSTALYKHFDEKNSENKFDSFKVIQ